MYSFLDIPSSRQERATLPVPQTKPELDKLFSEVRCLPNPGLGAEDINTTENTTQKRKAKKLLSVEEEKEIFLIHH